MRLNDLLNLSSSFDYWGVDWRYCRSHYEGVIYIDETVGDLLCVKKLFDVIAES